MSIGVGGYHGFQGFGQVAIVRMTIRSLLNNVLEQETISCHPLYWCDEVGSESEARLDTTVLQTKLQWTVMGVVI